MTAAEFAARTEARRSGDGRWLARCPGHEDKRPSLSIASGRDGRVLLRCFAGCDFEDVVAAMGLEPRDLFPPREGDVFNPTASRRPAPAELAPHIERLEEQGRELRRIEREERRDAATGLLFVTEPALRHMSPEQRIDLHSWIADLERGRE
jgi:hypothetical protein